MTDADTAAERARAELERIAADEMAHPQDVHEHLDVTHYLDDDGHVDKDAVIRALAWVISERPELCKYGTRPGQIGPDPGRQPDTGVQLRRGAMSRSDRYTLYRWASRPTAPCIETMNGMVDTAPFPNLVWAGRVIAMTRTAAAEIGAEMPTRLTATIRAYPPASGLPWHADNWGVDPDGMTAFGLRRITLAASMVLNDCAEFTGGEFQFRDRDPVHLEGGDWLAFGGDEVHRVWSVLSGLRVALVVIAGIGVGPLSPDPRVIDM